MNRVDLNQLNSPESTPPHLASLTYLFPPPEFLAPPPGGLWADLPARAVAHRRPLSSKISQYNGTLSALLNPEHLISSTYRNTHIHIQATVFGQESWRILQRKSCTQRAPIQSSVAIKTWTHLQRHGPPTKMWALLQHRLHRLSFQIPSLN